MNKKIKTLIIYETGIHYIIIINEKKQPPYEQNYIQSLKTTYNQYLQESKLQPKVKVVVYESEADNSAKKNHSTSTRSPVQTQETVYELSRSRKNGVSFKEKAKRTTTKKKTNRKKQKKSRTLGLEAIGKLCRYGRMIYYSS